MKFISTRDKSKVVSASVAILEGISGDGGLYVPEFIPNIKNSLKDFLNLDYNNLAVEILSLYFEEFSKSALSKMVDKAYNGRFQIEEKVRVSSLGKINFLELYHGPTAAFKDMALCLLPYLMNAAASLENDTKERIILTATSGDTGKAALEGFKDIKPYKVIVFYPEKGVSAVQKQQMITTEAKNSYVIALDGNFDHAQTGVKKLFADGEMDEALKKKNMVFSSANSINVGRLIPQIVYYFYGYLQMVKSENIDFGEVINVAVPTGNFGNILAAYMAKLMGLPIDKLICGSNSNDVLTEFINTGTYNSKRDFFVSVAPSMDILVSSNLERYLYFISNGDTQLVAQLMNSLSISGNYKLPQNLKSKMKDLKGYCYNDKSVLEEIKSLWNKERYLMDTHTAIGYLSAINEEESPVLIASTASPFKFTGAVANALGVKGEENEFNLISALENYTKEIVPSCLKDLDKKPKNKEYLCQKDSMKAIVKELLEV